MAGVFLLVAILVPISIYILKHAGISEAAWFNSNWAFRKSIAITAHTAAETNVYINLTGANALDTSDTTKFQADCGDLRFTDVGGKVLPYYIVSGCATSTTVVHVFFQNFPAGAQTIYFYYGNPSASNGFSASDFSTEASSYTIGSQGSEENGPGPVAHWKFDEGTGSTAKDSTTNGLNGTLPTASGFEATGGTITESGGNTIHTFTSSGTFTPASSGTVEYLVVGGGGSGGASAGGGGGAGGFRTATGFSVTAQAYTITVGNGGAGPAPSSDGNNGGSSTFSTITSTGGGKGSGSSNGGGFAAGNGGSGGGGHEYVLSNPDNWAPGTGTGGQGNNGGTASVGCGGAGGGGASAVGQNRNGGAGVGNGGAGTASSISGSSVTYAGGGGGITIGCQTAGVGGAGGGGDAAASSGTPGEDGEPNTGGGGGGGLGYSGGNGGAGGSGIVIISHTTPTGAPDWKTGDQCIFEKCLWFNGSSNENVSKSDDAKLDFAASDSFTVSAWVRRNGASSANNFILTKAVSGYTGYKLYQDASGDYCFDVKDGTNTDSACTSAVDFDDDKWHFVQGVKSGTTSITLYVDGIQRAQDASIAATGTLANSGTFYVGVDLDGTSNEWFGFIDEVKVYRYARSAAQIKIDYNNGAEVLGVSDANKNLSNGLVGFWKMDESSGDAADSSGNGTTLTDTNTVTFSAAKFGNGGDFESGSSEYQYAADNAALSITGSTTLAAWIKPESVTASTLFDIAGKFDGSNESYLMAQFGDEIRCYIDSSSNYVTTDSANLATGTWYHTACVYDSTRAAITIYVNGAISASTVTGTIPSSIGDDAGAFAIGAEDRNNTPKNFYDGVMDDVRVYNRAFSPVEVAQLYNFAPGPVAYYNFEEKQGTTVNDTSGTGNGASFAGTPSWAQGQYGGGVSTGNTTSDYVNAPNVDLPAGDWTAMSWFKYPLTSTGATWHTLFRGNGGDHQIIVQRSDMQLGMFDNTGGAFRGCGFIMTTLSSGWHHIATVGTGTIQNFYIDGIYKCQSSVKSTTDIKAIGNYQSGNQNWGQIDEVKIYKYARTAGQIVEDMNAGHPAPGSPVGSPIAYLKLNDGFGNVASNSGSVATLSAGLYNMASPATGNSGWTQNGKFGKALTFDGVDDHVRFFNNSQLGFTGNITLSAWVKAGSFPSSGNAGTIIEKGYDGTNESYYLRFQNVSGTPRIYCGSFNGSDHAAIWDHNLSTQTWYHLACIYDGTNWNIYVDGILKKSTADATGAINSTRYTFIGASDINATISRFFDGTIDEVKVFNSALTAAQVKLDYNRGQSLILGSMSDTSGLSGGNVASNSASAEYCVPGDTTSCASPVARFNFEERQGTTANDSSGNVNTGTLSGNASWTQGKYGGGIVFDGSSDIVTAGTDSSISITGAITVEAWVKVATLPGSNLGYSIVAKDKNTGGRAYTLDLLTSAGCGGTCFRFYVNGGGNLATNEVTATANQVQTNTWYHVVGTFVPSTSMHIYVNGVQAETNTVSSPVASINSATANLTIGGREYAGSEDYLNGTIDEPKIFNYSRSASQVAWDYNQGKPVAHWKMDECQGATINDSSGRANSGTLTIGASGTQTSVGTCSTASTAWGNGATGKYNYSLNFDGTDDYVDAGTGSSLDMGSGDFSLSAWFKTSSSSNGTIVGKGSSGTAGKRYVLDLNNTTDCSAGKIKGEIDDDTTKKFVCSTSNYNDGSWHQAVLVRSGNNLKLYADGKTAGTDTDITGYGSINSARSFKMGALYDETLAAISFYFNGQIDEVRVFNYALTKQQIRNVYNHGGAVRYGPLTGAP